MDRDFKILKDGYKYAEVKFRYDNNKSGKVNYIVYRSYIIDEETGARSEYPLFNAEEYVRHNQELKSVDAIKAFDLDFAKTNHSISQDLTGKVEIVYEPVHYRYVIGDDRHNIGIVDILTDFSENKKELQFTSARKVREDQPLSSDSTETNSDLIKRLAEQPWLDFPYFPVKEVEGWYV